MQFPAEFEWLSPSGTRRAHPLHAQPLLGRLVDGLLGHARRGGAGRLRPVPGAQAGSSHEERSCSRSGTDYTPPNKWVTAIHRDWNARYVWPRFVCGNPRDFFAAVRAELADRGSSPSPQTRDMNPVYTGKDVSYIDTKQAQRAAETARWTPRSWPRSPRCWAWAR